MAERAEIYPPGSSPAFRAAVTRTLESEGVFSDHRWDPGGATKYGITEAVARRHGFAVRELTVEQAVEIYWRDYWLHGRLDDLKSATVAAEIFDTAVNAGTGRAYRIAQQAAEAMGEPLVVDGVMGPATRGALNRLSARYESQLLAALNLFQGLHYLSLRAVNPELFRRAFKGWLRRLEVQP